MEAWAALKKVYKKTASKAGGSVTFPGNVWKVIDALTEISRSDSVTFTTQSAATVGIGWSYVDCKFVALSALEPEPPTPEELLAANISIRDGLLAQATLAIAPLQDAVDLEDATAAETALLKKWKQYRSPSIELT